MAADQGRGTASQAVSRTALEHRRRGEPGIERTEDLEPAEDEREHEAALRLSLDFAEIDAREGDYDEALRWLEVAERLNVTLPADYVQRRDDWRAAVAR